MLARQVISTYSPKFIPTRGQSLQYDLDCNPYFSSSGKVLMKIQIFRCDTQQDRENSLRFFSQVSANSDQGLRTLHQEVLKTVGENNIAHDNNYLHYLQRTGNGKD